MQFFEHQKTILGELGWRYFFAVFAEQGMSKTLPMLFHMLQLFKSGLIRNALVVCPNSVRGSWSRDIQLFFSPLERRIFEKFLTVTTYDLIWRRKELDRQWDLICLDESHFIKNRTSNRYNGQIKKVNGKRTRVTNGIKQISRASKYRYIMTGTPIGNSHWEEIWAQFDFLNPEILGPYSAFEKRYCILNQFYKPWRYINVEELKAKIAEHSIWIWKKDCMDLPEKLPPERYTVELLEKKLYKEMLKNYIAELDIEAKNPLARMTKLRQMCSGAIVDEQKNVHLLKCEKPAALQEVLENWSKKLVIFAHYKQSIEDIVKVLGKMKLSFVVLDGAQKDKNIWRRFQAEPELQVIVCQYQTAAAGIDLFAADTILFYEPTLSSQTFEQACDRIHRTGQQSKCSYILFETEGTIEVKIWNALMQHRDFNETELRAFVKEIKK
ncbi:DEAD/DEAH box helicase [Paenibacillus alkalitolerans]|uniref:DEAD/DEAH box helicase n=1 Tax=Paenibacillus alkalitolerans TaxID=2799335 RepID=UPI0018F6B73D|nr:DEAD/DEAH box helicase [Paenibacillus alkalitolerans]